MAKKKALAQKREWAFVFAWGDGIHDDKPAFEYAAYLCDMLKAPILIWPRNAQKSTFSNHGEETR